MAAKTENTQTVLEKATKTIPAPIPTKFTRELTNDIENFILSWLGEHELAEMQKLFGCLTFWTLYRIESMEHGGKVSADLGAAAPQILQETLQHLSELGYWR